jgi:hypothetical protein
MPLLQFPTPLLFPFLCVLSDHIPFCHSVPWDSLPLHVLCPRSHCQVCVTRPPPSTATGYTFVERRWRCVKHYLFCCNASPPDCPDPTDLWLDLLDLLSGDAVAAARVRALHVDSSNPADVRRFCMPWLLDPPCFLSAFPCSFCAAICSVIACYVVVVGATVADINTAAYAAVPAGHQNVCLLLVWYTVAWAISRCRLRPVLPGVAPRPSVPSGVLRPKPPWGKAWSSSCLFFCGKMP